MSTPAGNRKIAANLRAKHGVDENGKSLFHKSIGSAGGTNSPTAGYFGRLKKENPERLAEIAKKAAAARKAKQNAQKNTDQAQKHD